MTGGALIVLSAAWGAASLGYGHPALVAARSAPPSPTGGGIGLVCGKCPGHRTGGTADRHFPVGSAAKGVLGHSGSDANETAIRAVRRATGRQGIIGFAGAYHGCTIGSMAVSGHPTLASDKAAGLIQLPYPGADPLGPDADTILTLLERQLPK